MRGLESTSQLPIRSLGHENTSMNTPLPSALTKRTRDIIVIGAPVGGGAALAELVACFPPHLEASVFIVLQATETRPILLADVLNAPGRMRVTEAIDGEAVARRRIYVAADGKHLTVGDGAMHLSATRTDDKHWPSIDRLFLSAVEEYKDRVIGALLLNARSDGALGLHAIREAGGRTVTHRNDQMLDVPKHPDTGETLAHHHVELAAIAPCILAYVRPAGRGGSTKPPSSG